MLVDDDPAALEKLEQVLTAAEGWHFRAALTGGEALDVVTQMRPQIVIVKEDLPDLPGSMVVTTVKASAPDVLTLLYSPPGQSGRTGEVKLIDAGRVMTLVGSYSETGQLVGPLGEIREALKQKAHERRYLQAFRQKHFEFLQRYNGIKTAAQGRARPAQEEPPRVLKLFLQRADPRQVPVELPPVEAVADHERVGRREADEVERPHLYTRAWPRARRRGRWPAPAPASRSSR